ncbi:MAG: CPBP family intramembrane glutamic endopeptidase [Polyangiaceae bacterium]
MSRWGRYAAAYVGLALLAVVIGVWRGESLVTLPDAWLTVTPSHAWSAGAGLLVGLLVVVLTRVSVVRFGWARQLHRDLRPVARGLSPVGLLVLAVLSSLGEELLFRGALQPLAGVWIQALVFGLVHYVPGPSRWVWAAWAALIGLVLGLVYAATGSLLGPLLAHALINGVNLRFLKHHDPDPRPRNLGGLLGQRG